MGARFGPDNPLSGPRLPRDPRPHYEHGDTGDPAKGEKVARCLTCGEPASTYNRLIDFELHLQGRAVGRYRLCERDFRYANAARSLDPDPLHVEDGA